jgi:hypothetical protein
METFARQNPRRIGHRDEVHQGANCFLFNSCLRSSYGG